MAPSRRRLRWARAPLEGRRLRAAAPVALGVPAVAAVTVYGELSTQAFVAVALTGSTLAAIGLARRTGEAAPSVGRTGSPWLVWLAAAVSWEVLTLVHGALYTPSDIMDPILAHPPLRGAATVLWLLTGAWLLDRQRHDGSPS